MVVVGELHGRVVQPHRSEAARLLSAFLRAYAFAQLPAGGLVDRFGPRRLLGAGILLWSIAQGLTGFCANFGQFVFGRAILGLGEAPHLENIWDD